jgi:hypothetical protein
MMKNIMTSGALSMGKKPKGYPGGKEVTSDSGDEVMTITIYS